MIDVEEEEKRENAKKDSAEKWNSWNGWSNWKEDRWADKIPSVKDPRDERFKRELESLLTTTDFRSMPPPAQIAAIVERANNSWIRSTPPRGN